MKEIASTQFSSKQGKYQDKYEILFLCFIHSCIHGLKITIFYNDIFLSRYHFEIKKNTENEIVMSKDMNFVS